MAAVRIATEMDAEAIAAIYAPYVRETAISFEEVPPSPGEIATRVRSVLETYPYLVFEDGGRILGYANGSVHRSKPAYRWSVETTVYTARDAQRGGIGRALYRELLDLLRQQGYHAAFAGIALPNDKSVGFHEAMGFRYIGTFPEIGFKHGNFHDLGWWHRRLTDGKPDRDPIPFRSLALR